MYLFFIVSIIARVSINTKIYNIKVIHFNSSIWFKSWKLNTFLFFDILGKKSLFKVYLTKIITSKLNASFVSDKQCNHFEVKQNYGKNVLFSFKPSLVIKLKTTGTFYVRKIIIFRSLVGVINFFFFTKTV